MKSRLLALLMLLAVWEASAFEVIHDYYPGDVMFLTPGEERVFNIQLQNAENLPQEVELVVKANESITIKTYDATYPLYKIPAKTKTGAGRTDVRVVITQPADYQFIFTSKTLTYVNMTDTNGNLKPVSYISAVAFKLLVAAGDNTTTAQPIILAKAIENVSRMEEAANLSSSLLKEVPASSTPVILAVVVAAYFILNGRRRGREEKEKGEEEEIIF